MSPGASARVITYFGFFFFRSYEPLQNGSMAYVLPRVHLLTKAPGTSSPFDWDSGMDSPRKNYFISTFLTGYESGVKGLPFSS